MYNKYIEYCDQMGYIDRINGSIQFSKVVRVIFGVESEIIYKTKDP